MDVPSKAATQTQAVAPRTESTANCMPENSRLAPTIGGQNPSAGRPKKTVTQMSQTVSPQDQPTNHQSTPPQDETTPESHTMNHHPIVNHNPLAFNLSHPDIKPYQPALRSNQPAMKHSHRPLISPHSACETRKGILDRKQMKPIRTTQTRQSVEQEDGRILVV
ncbi:hypothetical protein CASFOL_017819 [Castilleja foliolosa]|uniref:Uncharacterized protein n=1 Tax=Castilleja foliolosa TaxID=1961234 RepID=A0ABD3D8L0_9LAMI